MRIKNLIPLAVVTATLALGIFAAQFAQAGAPLGVPPVSTDINYLSASLGTTNGAGIQIVGSTATNVLAAIDIRYATDVGVFMFGAPSANDASVVTAVFSPSLDGTITNMDTSHVYLLSGTMSGTAGVANMISTNWPSAQAYGLGSYRFLICRYITNAAAGTTTYTNVYVAVPYKKSRLTGNP
jgi:hypothetical protein